MICFGYYRSKGKRERTERERKAAMASVALAYRLYAINRSRRESDAATIIQRSWQRFIFGKKLKTASKEERRIMEERVAKRRQVGGLCTV